MTLTHAPVVYAPDDAIAAESTLIIHRPRRRRWWPVALAVALGVALVAVAADQVTAPALSFDGSPMVWRTAPDDMTNLARVDNALGSEVTVGFEHSGTFSAQLALVNHGRYPVKVLGFSDPGAYYYGLESVETAPDIEGPRQPFHSFTLRRGANGLPAIEKTPVAFKRKSLQECQNYRKGYGDNAPKVAAPKAESEDE